MVLLVLSFNITCFGQTVSLPLDGYFRPGSYFPIAITTTADASVSTDGSLVTHVHPMSGVVAVFTLAATSDRVRCGDQSLPLHALADSDRLIGCTTHDDALVQALFPDQHPIVIDLNPTDPLPGPSIAWEALDAVVVDAIAPDRIAPILANGVTLAVRSDARPDAVWPWRRVRDAWVISPGANRPGLLGEQAYAVVDFWHPGRSAAARQIIVIVGILCVCLMLAISMWRSRWNVALLAAFAAIFCAGFQLWRGKHPDVFTFNRQTRITGDVTRVDRWIYQTAPADTEANVPFDGSTWPVFASASHAGLMRATLDCGPTGQPIAIRFPLAANTKMALVSRQIEPGPSPSR